VSKQQQLRTQVWTCPTSCDPATCTRATDGAYNQWMTYPRPGSDSPLDQGTKNRALSVYFTGVDHHAEVFTKAGNHINLPVDEMSNLSFDIRTRTLQGGSPRINVVLQDPLPDGSTYIAISDRGWR
jgi:hypothetical protein